MTNTDKLAEALRECEKRLVLLIEQDRHKLLDAVAAKRATEALAEYDALPKVFTVFIRDLSGTGTTFITRADADDVEAAKEAAIVECLDAWGQPDTPTSRDALHVLGVAPGDINFIEWNDLES